MKIVQAKNIGFCMGVERAVRICKETLKKPHSLVYSYGEVIHNPLVNTELKEKGLRIIYDLDQIRSKGILVVPSHGMPPKLKESAEKKGLKIVDVTCPFVLAVQKICEELKDKVYFVIIVGDSNHPEIKTLLGIVPEALVIDNTKVLLDNLSSDKRVNAVRKIALISQTTQDKDFFFKVVEELIKRCAHFKELRIFNTICNDTINRQEGVKRLAAQVDKMIVIGGRNSANTKRLVQISSHSGRETFHIQEKDELKNINLAKNNNIKIGVASGASTPYALVEEIVGIIKSSN